MARMFTVASVRQSDSLLSVSGLAHSCCSASRKRHFVGITWADGEKKGGFVMQCDKNDYRGILLGLEGVTGKKAVDSDAMTVKN
jgi:hypothetical protein